MVAALTLVLGATARADEPIALASPAASPTGQETPRPASGTPLDATRAEVARFYGPVQRANARVRNHQIIEGSALDGDLYSKNGLIIRVVFYKGRSVLLEYTRVDGPLAVADVNPFLTANAGSSTWEQGRDSTDVNKFYHRIDGQAVAHWSKENDGSLLISAENPKLTGEKTAP